jgi:dipeptidyl aminopeptidase/acylaminoacyl peptidase
MSRKWKITIGILAVLVILWCAGGYVAATIALTPKKETITDRDKIADKDVSEVTIRTEDGLNISAWYVKNSPDRVVVFLPGIGSCRTQFVSRAEFYISLGYSVLMPDFRSTGKSEGKYVSIGWNEHKDLIACMQFLRDQGYAHIGAHGISMGAAAICYTMKDVNDYSFVVLESSYDTMDHALFNRMDLKGIPHFVAYPMKWFAEWIIGTRIKNMAPVDFMKCCKAPTFVMGGDNEGFLKVSETQSIFDQCAAKQKKFYIFKGAHHGNLLRQNPDEFKKELTSFLDEVSATWTAQAQKPAA